jgi:hypothetical protein
LEITTRILSVGIESLFKKPLLRKEVHYDDLAQKYWETFSSYGLKPTQIVVRTGDIAFNHDLSFSLFNGNATFRLTSEKAEIHFQNAASPKDFDIVADCISKTFEHVPLPESDKTSITAQVQATASSVEAVNHYMARFSNPEKQIVQGGAIVHVVCAGWPEEIRMTVERSIVFSEGIFLTWQTKIVGAKVSRDLLKTLAEACEDVATRLDLVFSNQQVQ